jgi:hypothetical protein
MKSSYHISVLTQGRNGHTLHHRGVFSRCGNFVVFDGRNEDTKIGENGVIGIVNVHTGVEELIYQCPNQSKFGPGVGAASFCPTKDEVIFIHGLADANEQKPYAINRRTGFGVSLDNPMQAFAYDARDIVAPYTPGSLRGGTHAHAWSNDGKLISFTYNDALVEPNLRTIGVLIPQKREIKVNSHSGNVCGSYYAALLAEVVENPRAGSDEICKAFDECWLETPVFDGNYQLAFQGNVLNTQGQLITEVFCVEVSPEKILADPNSVGKWGERPSVPKGIQARRITFSDKGLSNTRHWLRSSKDGKHIYALAKDDNDINQIITVELSTGKTNFLTQSQQSIDYSFNLSPSGNQISYIAGNQVWLYDLPQQKAIAISQPSLYQQAVGAPSFSPKGDFVVFNAYLVGADQKSYLQILKIEL